MIIGSSHHQEAFVFMRKFFYQLLIIIRIVIGTVGQFLVHTFKPCLHFGDVFKSFFRFFHNRTLIT